MKVPIKNISYQYILYVKIIKDISKALIYSHSNGIVHRDLRAESVIFGSDGKFKL